MAKNKNKNARHTTPATKNAPVTHKRSFNASVFSRLTADWGSSQSINLDLFQGLKTLRNRARDMSLNNEFVRRYLNLIKSNVVGADGVQLSVQATLGDGTIDPINDRIENIFDDWGRPENCTVTGRLDWRKVQELVLETVARDGESLVWFRRGAGFGKYYFQLQILDADHLDETYTTQMENGNNVFQGVEMDGFGRAVAYHLWKRNPSDSGVIGGATGNERIRVEAKDLLHIFDTDRASQVRGYPWLSAAMVALHHIGKYRESELISAREASAKQVYFKQTERDATFGDEEDEVDDLGNITFDSQPGARQILPMGMDIRQVDWQSPHTSFGDFQTNVLRGVAASLNISYHTLANDLEKVNYSSARFGGLEDQSQYRSKQRWFINALVKPVWEEWLKMQLLTNAWKLNIPFEKFEKFNNVRFIARTWQSVDPVKDTNADILLLENSLTSYSDVITKSGRDPDEVFAQIAKDKAKMAALGITPADLQESLINSAQPNKTAKNEE